MLDSLLDYLQQSYADPLFITFPVITLLISSFSFLLFAGLLTLLAIREPTWFAGWRIQPREKADYSQIKPAIKYWLANNLILAVVTLAAWPLLRLSGIHAGPLPPWWLIALQLLLFIYLDDFLYYWMHRSMHRVPWLFKKVHSVHHRVKTPWAISGHYMHPVEYVLTGSLMLLGPLLLGSHVVVVWLWVIFRQWEASEGHCGYRFPFSPSSWLPGSDAAGHHDFHHMRPNGNYAGFLAHTDRWFGSLAKGYESNVR